MNKSQSNRIWISLFVLTLCLSGWLVYSWPSLAQTPSEANQSRWLDQESPAPDSNDLTVADLPTALQYTISERMGAEEARYHIKTEGDWPQVDSGGLTITFEASGPRVTAGQSELALELVSLGYGQAQQPVVTAHPQVEANRVEYQRGPVTEWYANGPLGMQQGFTLAERPTPQTDDQLTLTLALSEGWQATVAAEGRTASLIGPHGIRLSYGELFVYDAKGRELPASLSVGQENGQATLQVHVDDQEAHYPLTIDPFIQQAKLTALTGKVGDIFGATVAVDGDTVVIGAWRAEDLKGAAYVYEKPANGWADATQTAKLTVSDDALLFFGVSVAISGDTVIVGAFGTDDHRGAAYIFEKPTNGWTDTTQTAKLTESNRESWDRFGVSVAISGDTIVIGADDDDSDLGAAYIFEKPINGWIDTTQTAKLTALNRKVESDFGYSVAIDGNTIIVGAPEADNDTGVAYLFQKPTNGWIDLTETAQLNASDRRQNDEFGEAVAISGNTVIIGAPGDDNRKGAAYLYERPTTGWVNNTETAKLTTSDGGVSDDFGIWVAIRGDTIVIGASDADGDLGAVYIFDKPISGWSTTNDFTTKLTASDGKEKDYFGISVSISSNTIVVGAFGDDGFTGSAYVFTSPPKSEIAISGNDQEIIAGDTTPTSTNHTDFGSTNISVGILQRTFTIYNTGNDFLNLNGSPKVALSGADAGDFMVIDDPISPIAPDGNTSFTIQFNPTVTGTRVATVTIANNDTDKNPYTFAIQGTGTTSPTPEIVISGNGQEIITGDTIPTPNDHTDFGSTSTDSGSVQRTFTIANTGDGDLTVSDVTLTGLHSSDFTVIEQPVSPVAANDSTSFTIQFDPSDVGLRTAQVSLTNNDSDESPYTFAIQGTGTAAKSSVYLPLLSKP